MKTITPEALLKDLRELIAEARQDDLKRDLYGEMLGIFIDFLA